MMRDSIEGLDSLHPSQQQLYGRLAGLEPNECLTLEDMRSELGVSSLNTIVHHLMQLERKGYIQRDRLTGRIKTLARPLRDIIYLNLYGMAGCGPNGFFLDEENVVDRIPFPAKQLRVSPNTFLVEARNNSMEPMIHDGDLVFVEPATVVSNGEVALVVHQNEAKLKRFFHEGQQIVLQSLNPMYKPIVASAYDGEVRPVGVVRGVVRNFARDDLKIQKSYR